MQKGSNAYTFLFALIVCVVCSFSISFVSEGLKSKKELNVSLDIKKNILKAVVLREAPEAGIESEALLSLYKEKIEEWVVDAEGNIVEGKKPDDLKEGDDAYPLYVYKEGQETVAYCFPISGKGLWSTLYGYFALEPDAMTVRGVTFYKHGETPGLGAEIEKDWFLDNYKGKKIWDKREKLLKPVAVVKGKVADFISKDQADFYVDGISGATITSKGVTALVANWVNIYEPFLGKIRKN